MNFNELNWHDAVIDNIELDRKNPGSNDVILFDIKWPTGQTSKIVFEDVYFAKMNLNFGVVAPESILSAFVSEKDDIDLINFYSKWKGLMDDVELTCYIINTASTGSEIKILAKRFKEIK